MSYRVVRLAGFAVASILVSVPAQAQGLMDIGRMIIGLPAEEKPPIEYRERAPLVVPPNSQTLRPPVDAASPDQRRANWPQDPDVLARRKAAEDARKPVYIDSITGREIGNSRRLTNDEIRAGRVAGQEVVRTPQQMQDDKSRANVLGGLATLREMDRQSAAGLAAGDNLDRTEPRREYLTEPPVGVRRPAANAAFKATREGGLGIRQEPSPLDIFKEQPNTR